MLLILNWMNYPFDGHMNPSFSMNHQANLFGSALVTPSQQKKMVIRGTIAGAPSARVSWTGASSRPWQMGYAAWPSAKRFHRLQFKADCFGMKYSPGCGYLIMTGQMPGLHLSSRVSLTFKKMQLATCRTASCLSQAYIAMAMGKLKVFPSLPRFNLQLKIPFSWPISFVEHWKSE